jgi:hypothetical protein
MLEFYNTNVEGLFFLCRMREENDVILKIS